MKKIYSLLIFFILIGINVNAQDTVRVDSTTHFQTIKGWGAEGGWNTQFENTPPYLLHQILDVSVNDLGLTGLRYECYQGNYSQSFGMCRTWEWQNDNGSPDTTIKSTFDTTAVDNYIQNVFLPFKQMVVARGEPFNFYESPSWYVQGSTGNIPAFLFYSPGEYAEYLISNLLYLKNKYGLVADYVTMCNEAGNGNMFTASDVGRMIKTVGPRLQQAGLSTTIQFPECVSPQVSWQYIQALQSDNAVWPWVKCLSYHLYGTMDPYRADISAFAATLGIPTAQREYVGLGVDLLYTDLTLGNVSYWDFYGSGDYMPLNTNTTWFTHGAKFWTDGQVIRHVQPGAIRVSAVSNDTTERPLAFRHNGQTTVVLLNDNSASTTHPVTITGLVPGNYGVGQSTLSGTYSELGVSTVGSNGILTVTSTAQTVITIYPHPANLAPFPTNWAANPTYLDLPSSSVSLTASAIDPELSIVNYHWAVDSFPSGGSPVISNPNIANPTVSGMTAAGNYYFSVTMSDGTLSSTKQVTVQVFPNNQPPEIVELQSRIPVLVTLPDDSTYLRGFAQDVEGDALTYLYSVVSQPSGANAILVTPTASNTLARNLTIPGNYVFKYAVSDPTHTVSRNITVPVYPVDNAPVITSVSSSPQITNLTADSSLLSSVSYDPDNDIITHWWTIQSVPSGANPTFSAQGERQTEVGNLSVPGTYVFKLWVIDRTKYATMLDTVIVNNTTGIKNNVQPVTQINLFPNPTNGTFTVTYNLPSPSCIFQVKDITGRSIISRVFNGMSGKEIFDVSALSSGIYFWEVKGDKGVSEKGKIALMK